MCYKLSLLALSALIALSICGSVRGAAVDQSQLVVEKQPAAEPQPEKPVDDASVPEQCHQPKETGRCFALFYRFAYNLDTHACEEFVYGGCAGNSNNFETKADCEQVCLGKAPSGTDQATEPTTESQQLDSETTDSAPL